MRRAIVLGLVCLLVGAFGARACTSASSKLWYWSEARMGAALAGPTLVEGVTVKVAPDKCVGLGHFTLSTGGVKLFNRFTCVVSRKVDGVSKKVTVKVRATGPFTYVVIAP